MDTELQKLRIDKSMKARRGSGGSVWPWIVVILLLLGGGGVGYVEWQRAHAPTTVETTKVPMTSSSASAGPSDNLILLSANGYVMAAHRVELASKVIGRVSWVGVEMGDKVKKGDKLVQLEDDEYQARLTQAQGQLDAAQARLDELNAGPRLEEVGQAQAQLEEAKVDFEKAQRNFKRLAALRNTSSLSQTEVDDAESAAKAAQARVDLAQQQFDLIKAGPRKEQIRAQEGVVEQLRGAVKMAKLDLNNTVIYAPAPCTILERNVEIGEFVTTGFVGDRGAKGFVVSIADLNDLLVELDISQDKFSNVSYKQPCWIVTAAYPDKRYNGVVELISPVANRQKATIEVRVKVSDPDDLLKPDMDATVSFLATPDTAKSAAGAGSPPPVRIPSAAVHDGAVFIVVNGKAVKQAVKTGLSDTSGSVEILSGLSGGEDLIANPPGELKDGDAVKVR